MFNMYSILVKQTNDQVWQLLDAGQYQEARELAEGTLDRARKYLPIIDKALLDAISNMATVCFYLEQYDKAESLFRELIEIDTKLHGSDSIQNTGNMAGLAKVYWQSGRHQEAQALFEQILESRRTNIESNPKHLMYLVTSLEDLANFYQDTGRAGLAEPLLAEAQAYRTSLQRRAQVDANNSKVIELIERGDYQSALEAAQAVLAEARQWLSPADPYLGTSLNNLGIVYFKLARYVAAEPLFRAVVDLDSQTYGPDHPQSTLNMSWLADLYWAMKKYDQAESLMKRILEIREQTLPQQPGGLSLIAEAADNLATFYVETGRSQLATPLREKALEIFARLGSDLKYAVALNNAAIQYMDDKEYARASEALHKSLEIKEEYSGVESLDYADTLQLLAGLHQREGRLGEAETLQRQVLATFRNLLGAHHEKLADALYALAQTLIIRDGDLTEALGYMVEAAAIEQDSIVQALSLNSERHRIGYLIGEQGRLARFLSLALLRDPPVPGSVQAALDLLLRRKSLALESLALQQRTILAGDDPSLHAKLNERSDLRQSILDLACPTAQPVDERAISVSFEQYEQLEEELAWQTRQSYPNSLFQTVDCRKVASALPAESALIEIVCMEGYNFEAVEAEGDQRVTAPHYLAFVLRANEPEQLVLTDLGEAKAIDQALTAWLMAVTGEVDSRDALGGGGPSKGQPGPGLSEGIALRRLVIDRLLPALNGCSHLFIAPDGALVSLPFGVLPLTDTRYVMDDYLISYLRVGRELLRTTPESRRPSGPALVIADPDYDLGGESLSGFRPGRPFPKLEKAREEGRTIAKLLGVRPQIGTTALTTKLKDRASPLILHLATHGFFLGTQDIEDPLPARPGPLTHAPSRLDCMSKLFSPLLRAGLSLSGANVWAQHGTPPPRAENGILTAEDVTGMDLTGTEMVVLSACNTGLGEVQTVEGVLGLRWAFIIAGVKTLVMSLWKVPDTQTRQLMELFYRNLLEGSMGRAEALRQAQLALRRQYPDKPFLWGAFICQGNHEPLPESSKKAERQPKK